MLLDYFGLWYRSYTSGSAGSKGGRSSPNVVVVEYAGKEYRIPVSELEQFLMSIREEPKVRKIVKKRVRKNKKAQFAPVVKLVDAPEEEVEHIQEAIDRGNEKLHYVWNILLQRRLQDMDDEEAILLLVMT